jgi:hypothetical protein
MAGYRLTNGVTIPELYFLHKHGWPKTAVQKGEDVADLW